MNEHSGRAAGARALSAGDPGNSSLRRNCPWTETEHRLFLLGLMEHGRGKWLAIATDYVTTRTATQARSLCAGHSCRRRYSSRASALRAVSVTAERLGSLQRRWLPRFSFQTHLWALVGAASSPAVQRQGWAMLARCGSERQACDLIT